MDKLSYTIDIEASKQHVWDVMLADETYRQWTSAFHEGSYFEGSWEKGSKIRFLAVDGGKVGGMTSRIAENIPYEYISIEHLGEVIDGQDDTTSEQAKQWAGAHEDYKFEEQNGTTKLTVEMYSAVDMDEDMKKMFEQMWPKALLKLKDLVERRRTA